jgi:hypothetical protein
MLHRKNAFLAGVWTACAFLCWQPMLLAPATASIVLFMQKERRKLILKFFARIFDSSCVLCAYFWLYHALSDALFQSYIFAGQYMSHDIPAVAWMLKTTIRIWSRATGIWNPLWLWVAAAIVLSTIHWRTLNRNPARPLHRSFLSLRRNVHNL